MDFFDFDFDFQDCLRAVLAAVFLFGSVQLHAVLGDRLPEPVDDASPPASVEP
jgi:hypothetical protein